MNLGALHSPDYRRYLLGNVFALNGTWLIRITLSWIAWELTGQAGFVGLVAFLVFAPAMVFGPVFGVLADRIALKRAAVLAQSGLALSAVLVLLALVLGILTPALLAALALGLGIVSSAHHPIRLSLAPSLVPPDAIGSAVALGSIVFNLARLTGPAIGGIVIAASGASTALGLAALLYLPQIALTPGLVLRPAQRARRDTGLLAALREGIAYAAREPLIRRAMLLTGLFSVLGRGLLEILPVLADGVFGRGATGLGALTAAAGAGALAAAALIALGRRPRPGSLPLMSRLGAPIGFTAVALAAWVPSWPMALAVVALLGLCGTTVGVGLQTSVQLALADTFRARVMSLWTMLAIGGAALGALGLGGLIDLVGPRAALTAAGLAGLVLAIPLLLPLPATPALRSTLQGGHLPGTPGASSLPGTPGASPLPGTPGASHPSGATPP